jgi:hypothetical protein
MMVTYLFAAALALVGRRIVLGWVDGPFLIGCQIAALSSVPLSTTTCKRTASTTSDGTYTAPAICA